MKERYVSNIVGFYQSIGASFISWFHSAYREPFEGGDNFKSDMFNLLLKDSSPAPSKSSLTEKDSTFVPKEFCYAELVRLDSMELTDEQHLGLYWAYFAQE